MQCPRRALLAGVGLAGSAVVLGSTVLSDDDPTDTDSSESGASTEFDELFAYLPATIDGPAVSVVVANVQARRKADEPYGFHVGVPDAIDPSSLERSVRADAFGDGSRTSVSVLSGSVEIDGESERRETDAGTSYDRYETRREIVAETDDVVLVADSTETIEAAIDTADGEMESLFDRETRIEDGLETFSDADERGVHLDEHLLPPVEDEDDPDISFVATGIDVIDPDTIEMQVGFAFDDERDITDEVLDAVRSEFSAMGATEELDVTVDDELVVVTLRRDLAAERAVADHDSPGQLRLLDDVDADAESVEIEIGRGDPTPIEELTLTLDDREIDPAEWADGESTIEAGDKIFLPLEDVEPNTQVRITHEHDLGSRSSGTTILAHLRFAFDFDADRGELRVGYADSFPLDGDRISIVAYDAESRRHPSSDDVDPVVASDPWDGETVTEGDEATVEGIEPGNEVLVTWDGTGHEDGIAHYFASPPGRATFDFDYASNTLSVTLSVEDERDADEYTLLIEDEPASTQWRDVDETIADESTIEVSGIDVGTHASVQWNDDVRVGSSQATPEVRLEFDPETGTVEHVGGDDLPAETLTVKLWGENGSDEITLGDLVDGTFAEGDSFAIDRENVRDVALLYDDLYVDYAVRVSDADDESAEEGN